MSTILRPRSTNGSLHQPSQPSDAVALYGFFRLLDLVLLFVVLRTTYYTHQHVDQYHEGDTEYLPRPYIRNSGLDLLPSLLGSADASELKLKTLLLPSCPSDDGGGELWSDPKVDRAAPYAAAGCSACSS